MNPTGAGASAGYHIAFPGYLPLSPGNDIPSGGPQKLMQLYQDQTWLKGKHDIRFGGSYVHIRDDHTFGAYANAVEALNTTSAALTSLNNFVRGTSRRFQTAINPNGFPGGTYSTPVPLPELPQQQPLQRVRALRQRQLEPRRPPELNLGMRYEYYGPQTKSDPKYDSNFYYGDPNRREHQQRRRS